MRGGQRIQSFFYDLSSAFEFSHTLKLLKCSETVRVTELGDMLSFLSGILLIPLSFFRLPSCAQPSQFMDFMAEITVKMICCIDYTKNTFWNYYYN